MGSPKARNKLRISKKWYGSSGTHYTGMMGLLCMYSGSAKELCCTVLAYIKLQKTAAEAD
jgi:hypothetical protein